MNLTDENYFSKENNLKYAGSSQIKSFVDCEARTIAELKGEWQRPTNTSLLVGSFVDASVSRTLEEFTKEHPEVFKRDGTLKSEYIQATYILERMQRDELFSKYLGGDHQTIMTGNIEGVPIKIKIDSYHKDKAIVDLKCVRNFEPIWNPVTKEKENFVDYWKYTWQGALYQEIVFQNTGKKLPFFICAVTKELEPDLAILSIPQDVLDEKLNIIKTILPRIKEIKEGRQQPTRCEHCDYCKSTKKLTKIINYQDLDLI